MNLLLKRKWFTDRNTVGELFINGEFFCYTMEDAVRPKGEKVAGKTAIPYGTYKVVITHSNRFKKELPLLLAVPMFSGIRIHSGNTEEDTEGCILVGMSRKENWIGYSRRAMEYLMERLKGEVVTMTIGV